MSCLLCVKALLVSVWNKMCCTIYSTSTWWILFESNHLRNFSSIESGNWRLISCFGEVCRMRSFSVAPVFSCWCCHHPWLWPRPQLQRICSVVQSGALNAWYPSFNVHKVQVHCLVSEPQLSYLRWVARVLIFGFHSLSKKFLILSYSHLEVSYVW